MESMLQLAVTDASHAHQATNVIASRELESVLMAHTPLVVSHSADSVQLAMSAHLNRIHMSKVVQISSWGL